jgi:hypothetical protein
VKALRSILLLVLVCFTPSCYSLTHTVGGGPTGVEVVTARQWYWLWGLARFGPRIDSESVAGNATSYRVTTEWSFTDILLNVVTGAVSVVSQTVTVEK